VLLLAFILFLSQGDTGNKHGGNHEPPDTRVELDFESAGGDQGGR
jgi:hypothetical protein